MTRASARCARATLAAALTLLAGLTAADAGAAAVVNPSFERTSATSSEFTSQNDPLPIKGWEFWDPQRLVAPVGDPASGLATVLGVWRPSADAYPGGLPAGGSAAFLYAAAGAGNGELGLRQQTRTRLTAG
ncbi:MAG TPA: hypothetical protein VLK58_12850, partial [Conexibacter sp.]|nr:hypothetical protein [Conexibacter sp.]